MNAVLGKLRKTGAISAAFALAGAGIGCDKGGSGTTAPAGGNSSAPPVESIAQVGAVPTTSLAVEGQSKHFAEVSKYLDLGGPFYAYIDIDGDIESMAEKANEFYSAMAESGEMPEVNVEEVIAELGFGGVQALGGSSIKTPEGFRNKTFVYIPDGREGLLNLLGGDAEPMHYAKLAPAGADVIIEQELNLKAVRDTAEKIVSKFDSPEIEEPFNEMLETKFADLSFTVADFLGNANGRVIVVASIVPDVPMPLPPEAPQIPSVDIMLCVENAGWLFDSLEEKFITEGEGPFDYVEEGGFAKMTMQVPPDGSMGIYAPIIVKEESTSRVFVASRQSYLDECLSDSPRIDTESIFQASLKELPVEGNSFSYMSPEIYEQLEMVMSTAMEQAGGGMGPEGAVMSAMQSLSSSFMPKLSDAGIATVGQNLPNGILYVANSTASHKTTLASMSVMPLAMIGGVAAPMMAMQRDFGMQQQMQMDDVLGQPGDPFGGNVVVEDVAVAGGGEGQVDQRVSGLKLKQTFVALQGYAAENGGEFPDNLGELVPDRIDPSNLRITNQLSGQSRPLIYLPGRNTSSKGDQVVLAAPWATDGERFVIKVDGTTGMLSEDEFQLQVISSQQ